MKIKYRGCTIEVTKEKSITGDTMIFYSIFDDSTDYEIDSSFSHSDDSVREFANQLKEVVDDYILNPEDYE